MAYKMQEQALFCAIAALRFPIDFDAHYFQICQCIYQHLTIASLADLLAYIFWYMVLTPSRAEV